MTDIAAPNFDLNDEHRALLDDMTRSARAHFEADAMERDLSGQWPDDGFSRLAKMGVLGASVPETYGGAGLDLFSAGLVGQALGRVDPAVSTSWQSHDNLCVNNLFQNGSEAQRRRYLPGLSDGTLVGAIGMTEPNAGSDALGGMATTAIRDGDSYVLNGSKTYITNGPIADIVLVYAKTAPERGKKVSRLSLSRRSSQGFRQVRRSTRWVSGRARPALSTSTTAASRSRI